MQKKGANISLKGYDDIFSTDQSRAEAQQERVQEIPLSELHPFEGHPFRVVDDEDNYHAVFSSFSHSNNHGTGVEINIICLQF